MIVENLRSAHALRVAGIPHMLVGQEPRSQALSKFAGGVALSMLTSCSTMPDSFYDAGGISFSSQHDRRPDPAFVEVGNRVQGVAYRLKLASTEWCGPAVHYETGLSVWNVAVVHLLGLNPALGPLKVGASPTVLYVAPGSAAARAGVRPTDVIERVDDVPVVQGTNGIHQLEIWSRSLALSGTPTTMSLRRESEILTVNLVPDRVCDFRVTLKQEDWGIGHYAPDRNVMILLQDTRGDDDTLVS